MIRLEGTEMRYKKISIFMLLAVIMVASMGGKPIIAQAETGSYNFTVGTTNTYDDHYASKAGGSKFENCAYITPSYFSKTGNAWFWVKMKGQSVQTEKLLLSYGSETVTRHPYYTSTPTANLSYHVGAKIGSVSSGNTMNVKGSFTP